MIFLKMPDGGNKYMKRSEINREIRKAEEFFASFQFKLPKFAYWSAEELQSRRHDEKYREIFDCNLGWDLTDFGTGNFEKEGLFLFTIRNGVVNDPAYPKPYAEKIMISRVNQVTLTHCHEYKREDIINRGGGKLAFELFNRKGDSPELDDTPVTVSKDGEKIIVKAGEVLILEPGRVFFWNAMYSINSTHWNPMFLSEKFLRSMMISMTIFFTFRCSVSRAS